MQQRKQLMSDEKARAAGSSNLQDDGDIMQDSPDDSAKKAKKRYQKKG